MSAKPITTASAAQTVLPSWYSNQAQDLLAAQAAVTNRAYVPYTGTRLADFTPDTLSGLEAARRAANDYAPELGRAIDNTTFDPTRFQGAQGALDAATRGAGNISGAAQPYFDRAGGMSAFDAAQPTLNGALQYATAATNPTGIAMAAPYLGAASGDVTDVSAYMDPFNDAVVQHLGDLGARTLRDQLAPAINDKFIAGGQLRSSGQSIDEARALRDVYSDTLGKQAEVLQQGYVNAQGAKAGDLGRYASLAGTAGNLGVAQQGALSTAAGQIAGIGTQQGNFTDADRNALIKIGDSSGSLAAQQAQAQLAAAQQQGGLAQAMAELQLRTGAQQGALAQQQQTQGLAGADALAKAGALEQGQQQKSLDLRYEDFMRQQGYPQAQIDAALKTFQGVLPGVPTGTVGYQQETKGAQSPSAASTFLAGLTAAKGVGVI